jgi:hypothetical protein
MSSNNGSRGFGSAIIVAVIATVVGGVALALALPNVVSPNLKLLRTDLASSNPGNTTWATLTLTVVIHNDGSVSAGDCIAHWEGRRLEGQPFFHKYSPIFYVPANSDAISPTTNLPKPVPISYDVLNQTFPDPPARGNLVVYIICNGYQSPTWTIFSDISVS